MKGSDKGATKESARKKERERKKETRELIPRILYTQPDGPGPPDPKLIAGARAGRDQPCDVTAGLKVEGRFG